MAWAVAKHGIGSTSEAQEIAVHRMHNSREVHWRGARDRAPALAPQGHETQHVPQQGNTEHPNPSSVRSARRGGGKGNKTTHNTTGGGGNSTTGVP